MLIRTQARATASVMVLACFLLVGANTASAQTTSPATPAAEAPVPTVDAIVITAQKRVQSLQDVPIVVTAVNKALLTDTGVHDIKDLTILVPGLTVTSSTSESSTSARIRGIGTVGDNVGLESSVGVVIDGVYRPRNGVGFGDLGDVDRIEVLKGPQGTLFGKSTSAGVINIITAEPTFLFHSNAEFTAGNYGAVGGSASVSGPLVQDKVAASLYVADRQRNGFYTVDNGYGPRSSTQDDTQNFYSLRGQILAEPDNNLKVRVIADYTHRDEQCCAAVLLREGETQPLVAALAGPGGGEPATANPFNYTASLNRPDPQDVIDEGISAQVDYKMPQINASLTSITAFRNWKSLTGSDTDYNNADLFYRPGTNANSDDFQDFSQEIRFAGTAGKLDYLVGGFYANEELNSNFSLLYGSQFTNYLSLLFSGGTNPGFLQKTFGAVYTPNTGSVDQYRQRDNTYALFTNETYHITPKLDVNIGLRYTIDNKVLNSNSTNTNNGAGCAAVNGAYNYLGDPAALGIVNAVSCLPFMDPAFNNFSDHQSETENELSGAAKASYRFNPEVLTYISYARGFKAGGFNLDRVACPNSTAPQCLANPGSLAPVLNTSFPGEFADSYEIGFKSTLLHRTLLFNATAFYQHFTNFQLNTFTGLVFVVSPVPDVYSQGVDMDFVWLPTRNLSFQGGLTVADTRYGKSSQAALLASNPQYLGSPGERLPFAPLYSGSIAVTYSHQLVGDYMGSINFDAKYSSKYDTGSDLDPGKEQSAYWLADGRITLGPKSKMWGIEFWSQNMFAQKYLQVAFDSGFQNSPTNGTGVLDAFLGQPRTYGMTLRAKY